MGTFVSDLPILGVVEMHDRYEKRIAFVVIAAFVVYRLILVGTEDNSFWSQVFYDDAMYYLKTAQNAAIGNGVSFDGINPTNGFHPLWFLMLVPVFKLIPQDVDLALHVILTMEVILTLILLVLIYHTARIVGGRGAGILGVLLFMWPRFSNQMLNGMESGISLFLLVVAFYLLLRWRLLSRLQVSWADVAMGLILGLAVLARLDNVFLLLAIGLIVLWRFLEIGRLQSIKTGRRIGLLTLKLLGLMVPAVLLISAYLFWNLENFGHVIPISGRLKSSFPGAVFNSDIPLAYADFSLIVGLSTLLLGLFFAKNYIARYRAFAYFISKSEALTVIAAFSLAVVFLYSYILFFTKWAYSAYYFAAFLPVAFFGSALCFGWLKRILPQVLKPHQLQAALAGFWLLLAAGVIAGQYVSFQRKRRGSEIIYSVAIWAKENLPSDAVIAMTNPGVFAYFSERTVINTDGLINNFEFQEYLKERRFWNYLHDKEVCYIAEHEFPNAPMVNDASYIEYDFPIYSYLYESDGGSARVFKEREVFRSQLYENRTRKEPFMTVFVIWQLDFDFCSEGPRLRQG